VDDLSEETPLSTFRVRQGKKYRFRIVGGMCTSCAYKFRISQHSLLVIAVDGCSVEPVRVSSIDMYGGKVKGLGKTNQGVIFETYKVPSLNILKHPHYMSLP
jgi:FtsP/CotA-like multicopper oxidase with cupredoxin domain